MQSETSEQNKTSKQNEACEQTRHACTERGKRERIEVSEQSGASERARKHAERGERASTQNEASERGE